MVRSSSARRGTTSRFTATATRRPPRPSSRSSSPRVAPSRTSRSSPFTRTACRPIAGDGTRLAVQWDKGSLAELGGQDVRLRFTMTRGRLYAFWISPTAAGRSRGYVAAGGPGFQGPTD